VKISRPAGGKPCEDLSSRGGKGSDHRQRTPATHPRDAADDAHQRRQEGDRRGLKRSVNSELPRLSRLQAHAPWTARSLVPPGHSREARRNSPAWTTRNGISSHVRPSRCRPAFFLFTPPHCLKKNATRARRHSSRISTTPGAVHRARAGSRLTQERTACDGPTVPSAKLAPLTPR